jgi:YD repeat-containing protein
MSDTRVSGVTTNIHVATLRSGGVALVVGGLLWQPLLAFQNLAGLHDRAATWQWRLDQWGFLVAMTSLLVGLIALDRAGIPGEGRVGRGAMHVLVLAWGSLVLGQLLKLTIGWDAPALGIVGGLLTYPAALVAGYVVLRGGRLTGWRRWPLLVEGVYETLVILVPLLAWNWGPSWATEAGWQLCWVLLGAAALAQTRKSELLAPGCTPVHS